MVSGLGAQAQATVLINETFSDGERLTQSQPDSLHWYTAGNSNTTVASSSAGLTFLDTTNSQAGALAYFNAVNLNVGESLTLSFNYSFQQIANGDNNFMFALYNSGGSYVSKDGTGFNSATFNSYTGYAASGVFGSDPSGPGRDHIETRDKLGNNLRSLGTYTEGKEYIQTGAATPGEIYGASLQIARTAEGITAESKIGNTVVIQKYTTELFTQFDTVGIFANGNAGVFTMNDVKLDYAGVPEPPSFWAMAFLGMVVFGRVANHKLLRLSKKLSKNSGSARKREKGALARRE